MCYLTIASRGGPENSLATICHSRSHHKKIEGGNEMLSINMEDVIGVLQTCRPYLIALAVVLLLGIIVIIAAMKLPKGMRGLVRGEAGIAMLLAACVVANLICIGPMSTLLTLASGNGVVSAETTAAATDLCERIADEGIVLLKNDDLLPLDNTEALNVFGWASSNPVFGGAGSGSTSDAYERVTLLQGLANAGFKTNTELTDFYTAYRADRPDNAHPTCDWTLPEPPVDQYSTALMDNAKAFSDVALVVFARVGAEGIQDLPDDVSQYNYTDNSASYKDYEPGEHILQLSQSEENLLELVCENFDKVVVICNSANVMELDTLNEYKQVKGVLWCPGTGQSGFNSLGSILRGAVNPSGRTADTFPADITKAPYFQNIGSFVYDNMSEFPTKSAGVDWTPTFINYVEGIYVGYKYYETAYAEAQAGNLDFDYDREVVYPFGYGLSYTTFEQVMSPLSASGDTLTFDVTVTNTGDMAGKDVVEVYFNPPYYNGGIEKSAANLIAYEKTKLLEPGESQTVSISFRISDMASYDTHGEGCYVLDQGDYIISINKNSHVILDSKPYSVSTKIVYDEGNPRSSDVTAATNLFQNEMGEGIEVTYLSRADGFANYNEAVAAPSNYTLSADYKATFRNISNYDPTEYNNETDAMPVTGQNNGIKLADLRGADYDDPKWEQLLDELTVSEMNELIALGGFQTIAIDSIGKLGTVDCDGPASINNNFTGVGSIGFPSAVIIASTWNKELVEEFGASIGTMANDMGVSGWYAPGLNTHRSAFGARNFEYYSEDGVLAGLTAASAVKGAASRGVYAYAKHYALNDQETNRIGMLCTWCSEQAIRENYLKPFELAVKEGNLMGLMSSFNYVGTTWASGHYSLCTAVPRGEWGFQGMIVTDYFGGRGFMIADQAIRGGTDLMLVNFDNNTNYVADTTSATSVQAMRTACKHILFTTVNSRAHDEANMHHGLYAWQMAMIAVDVVIVAVCIALEWLLISKYKKSKAS